MSRAKRSRVTTTSERSPDVITEIRKCLKMLHTKVSDEMTYTKGADLDQIRNICTNIEDIQMFGVNLVK